MILSFWQCRNCVFCCAISCAICSALCSVLASFMFYVVCMSSWILASWLSHLWFVTGFSWTSSHYYCQRSTRPYPLLFKSATITRTLNLNPIFLLSELSCNCEQIVIRLDFSSCSIKSDDSFSGLFKMNCWQHITIARFVVSCNELGNLRQPFEHAAVYQNATETYN